VPVPRHVGTSGGDLLRLGASFDFDGRVFAAVIGHTRGRWDDVLELAQVKRPLWRTSCGC